MIPENLKDLFKTTLRTGGYNLLLGSGISLDSLNGRGETLRSSEALRRDLCTLTDAPTATSLSRVYPLLDPQQIHEQLIDRFSNCRPGPSIVNLPHFLWRRLFTFNIDDALEALYENATGRKQYLVTFNFNAPFEPTPERDELHAVHLHGYVRQPGAGFVFSASDYVRVMSNLNPWMHFLSETLATESFIIAGTSLDEIDLEYYLNFRSRVTPRRGKGPSLLVEPNPSVVTKADCERYGLVLIAKTFREFMDWLQSEFPSVPTVSELLVPDASAFLPKEVTPVQRLRFFSDFELVGARDKPLPAEPSPFLYGREPQWKDLDQHLDVEREDNTSLSKIVEDCFSSGSEEKPKVILVLEDPGTGKTTCIMRVAHGLAMSGKPVLSVSTLSRINVANAIDCLSRSTSKLLLVVDGLADHAEQILELLESEVVASRVVVLASERSYRREYLSVVLRDLLQMQGLSPLTVEECRQLVERYRQYGLVGEPRAITKPMDFAKKLVGDPVAIAVCRILNDFRPLDAIVESLWREADPDDRLPYLCVALAQHCYSAGLRYGLLQAIAGTRRPVDRLLAPNVPLRLAPHPVQDEFLIPINGIIAELILQRAARREATTLRAAFTRIGSALAPHVNRKAIMRRSPEARLAGRLFDADTVVRPLLGEAAEEFYISIQTQWEWNSRYWEQRALLTAGVDLDVAIQYARHAVAIERHPFPLTTLGKLLLKQMEVIPVDGARSFTEAFDLLAAAIDMEQRRSRITVHPFMTMLSGTAKFVEFGGTLTADQQDRIIMYSAMARTRFPNDALVRERLRQLDDLIGTDA